MYRIFGTGFCWSPCAPGVHSDKISLSDDGTKPLWSVFTGIIRQPSGRNCTQQLIDTTVHNSLHDNSVDVTTLVKSPWVDQISAVRSGIPLSSWDGAVLPHWEPSSDVWHQHSPPPAFCWQPDTATLVVLSTDHCTLGDRAFPVASAHVWNSLPPSVRNAPWLMSLRRNLKTVLFRSSFSS